MPCDKSPLWGSECGAGPLVFDGVSVLSTKPKRQMRDSTVSTVQVQQSVKTFLRRTDHFDPSKIVSEAPLQTHHSTAVDLRLGPASQGLHRLISERHLETRNFRVTRPWSALVQSVNRTVVPSAGPPFAAGVRTKDVRVWRLSPYH